MRTKSLSSWISIASVIGIVFGVFYAFFGLNGLPIYQKIVPVTAYTSWSNGLYGSVFIGFSVLLFFAGRHAFTQKDKTLMKALFYGIASWLTVEALFSFYYGVYLNVLVDIVLILFLGLPLIIGVKTKK